MPYIEKRIYSGPLLEIEHYPVGKKGHRIRAKRDKPTREVQERLNRKNAVKKLERLLYANFGKKDLFVTLTYSGDVPEIEQAKRDLRNYIRRLQARMDKQGMDKLKYISVTARDGRIHHHLIISGGLSLDDIEGAWGKGRVQLSRLDIHMGLEGLAWYVVKNGAEEKNQKRWNQSRNLIKPTVKRKQSSKRPDIYRPPRIPKGYKLLQMEMSDNDFTGLHRYIKLIKLE